MISFRTTAIGIEIAAGRYTLALEEGRMVLLQRNGAEMGLDADGIRQLRALLNDPRVRALIGEPTPADVAVTVDEDGALLAEAGDCEVEIDANGVTQRTPVVSLYLMVEDAQSLAAIYRHPAVSARIAVGVPVEAVGSLVVAAD